MRILFTGQTGIDKKSQLQRLREFCARKGKRIDAVFHVGDMMYQESRKSGTALKEGKILDLPQAQLAALRLGVFNLVRGQSAGLRNVFVNSHAVFRWNNRLFRAFELPEVIDLRPDVIVTLIDDVEAVKMRLDEFKSSGALPPDIRYSLKDLLVWREEEMLASEILSSVLNVPHYVLGVSLDEEVSHDPLEVVYHLMFEPWRRKTYVSYPITEARARPDVWEKVTRYRKLARSYLTAFDPLMIDENRLLGLVRQEGPGDQVLECQVLGKTVLLERREIEGIREDIDGQVVARDLKLIDQSEMIVAYFPAGADGRPLVSGGVQSEIEHAQASTKDIVIVWEAPRDPTPFIGQKGHEVLLRSLDELEAYLKSISQRPGQQEMPLWPFAAGCPRPDDPSTGSG